MADKPFRILLDVTDLYLENFKYVWVNISPRELKTISDLKKCVLRKINLEREDIQLFVRDGLLLDEETILVLREDDTVKVNFKASLFSNLIKDSLKESPNNSRKRSLIESDVNDEDAYQPEKKVRKKKRKKNSTITLDQTVADSNNDNAFQPETKACNGKNVNKSVIALDQTVANIEIDTKKSSDFPLNSDSNFQKHNKDDTSLDITMLSTENVTDLSRDSQVKDSNLEGNGLSEIVAIDNSLMELEEKTPRKRKRKRKRKQKLSITSDIPDDSNAIDNFEPISVNVDDNINRKHILYLSPNKNQDNNCSDNVIKLQNSSTDTFILKDKSTDIQSSAYPKVSTPAQASGCSTPDWQFSLMNNNNCNLSYNDKESSLFEKSSMKNASQNIKKNKSEKDLYEHLPDLTSLPILGVVIAYKVLELDDNYSPTVSDYRKGIVKKVNHETEEIEVKLIEDIILPGKTGKFENLGKDEIPEPIVKKHEVLKWNDMISPKVYNSI